jgi:cobalt-precorrin-5B (C1)-methyltransferase
MSFGRTGFTTGTCAAAAAKAATMVLCGRWIPPEVEVGLPDGTRVRLPAAWTRGDANAAEAAVRKDAGDDPDVTDGCTVVASVVWTVGEELTIAAGKV